MSSDTRLSRDVCACFASFSSFFGSPSFLKSGVDKRAFLRTKDLGSERFSRIGNNPRRYPPTPDIWNRECLFYSRFFASHKNLEQRFLGGVWSPENHFQVPLHFALTLRLEIAEQSIRYRRMFSKLPGMNNESCGSVIPGGQPTVGFVKYTQGSKPGKQIVFLLKLAYTTCVGFCMYV